LGLCGLHVVLSGDRMVYMEGYSKAVMHVGMLLQLQMAALSIDILTWKKKGSATYIYIRHLLQGLGCIRK
jgi:hypothetical protein